MPHAIIDWDLMSLPTTRHTPLTGDVKTVAVFNVMKTASFQMMDRWCSDMLHPGVATVSTLRQEMALPLLVPDNKLIHTELIPFFLPHSLANKPVLHLVCGFFLEK